MWDTGKQIKNTQEGDRTLDTFQVMTLSPFSFFLCCWTMNTCSVSFVEDCKCRLIKLLSTASIKPTPHAMGIRSQRHRKQSIASPFTWPSAELVNWMFWGNSSWKAGERYASCIWWKTNQGNKDYVHPENKVMYFREIKMMCFGGNKDYVLLLMPKTSRLEMMPPCSRLNSRFFEISVALNAMVLVMGISCGTRE